ncbi:serine/threonine-protein kinase [Streptomyces sp. NPDC058657]|uniref:serine/threonine-protein kinase n=1 Tax=unclassified Streptomyces TaxID=2593676 RepID=UPI003667CCEF
MEKLGPSDPQRIGAYRLLARLGAGGMGQVYLARSDRGRTVAVKLVRRELAEQEEFRSRFRQEVHAARRVGGRWTAPVLDADTDADIPWVATGYVAGPTLQQVVSGGHGPLPERSVLVLAAGLTHALQDIHAAGLIHRDLKPSNVLVTIDGPRVIDFGIARALVTVTDSGLTRTGALVGSPGFMAPEQVRGERVTAACDVFCLGSVLAYAATGRLPFGTSHSGVHAMMFRIAQEPPDLTDVPESLHDLIRDCLQKPPEARPTLAQLRTRTGPGPTPGDPWLPASLVAQLGIHAVQLLDLENPTTSFATDAVPGPGLGHGPGHGQGPGVAGPGPVPKPAAAAAGVAAGAAASAAPSPAAPGKSAPSDAPASRSGEDPSPQQPPQPPASHTPTEAVRTPPPPGTPHHSSTPNGMHAMPTYVVPSQTTPPAGSTGGTGGTGGTGSTTEGTGSSPDAPPAPGTPHGPPHSYTPHIPQTPLPALPPAGYGYPNQQNQPGQFGGYGFPTPPGAYAYPEPGGPQPPRPPDRSKRSTLALVAVALIVAIGSGGAVYAFMNSGGESKGSTSSGSSPNTDAKSPTEQGGSDTPSSDGPPSDEPDRNSDTPSSDSGDGTVPARFLGTWHSYIKGSPYALTLREGGVGDTVFSLSVNGDSFSCQFAAHLVSDPGASGPLHLSASRVVSGPAASCAPGKSSTLALQSDGSLLRTASDGVTSTYTR